MHQPGEFFCIQQRRVRIQRSGPADAQGNQTLPE